MPTPSDLQTWYKFLLAQMASESYLTAESLADKDLLEIVLRAGNNNLASSYIQGLPEDKYPGATRMTTTQVGQFTSEWVVMNHHANDASGFSATLLWNINTHEFTLSMRSTEYQAENVGGDHERDVGPTTGLAQGADKQIFNTGFAIGQLAAMEEYYAKLKSEGWIPPDAKINVTGYSLSGHLATVFTELHTAEINHTYLFNAAGRGTVNTGAADAPQDERIRAMLLRFNELLQDPEAGHYDFTVAGPDASAFRDLHDAAVQAWLFDPQWKPFESGESNMYADPRYQWAKARLDLEFSTSSMPLSDSSIPLLSSLQDPLSNNAQDKITQVYGHGAYGDFEMVANTNTHTAATIPIYVEDQPNMTGTGGPQSFLLWDVNVGDFGTTHSLTLIADSLALMIAFQKIAPDLTQKQIEEIFAASSNLRAQGYVDANGHPTADGRGEVDSLENVLDALRNLFLGGVPKTNADPTAAGFGNILMRDDYFANIDVLTAAVHGSYQIVSLAGVPASELIRKASQNNAEGLAYRYALKEAIPFVVLGNESIYAIHNAAGELDFANPSTGQGDITETWIEQRAAFVERKLYVATHDENNDIWNSVNAFYGAETGPASYSDAIYEDKKGASSYVFSRLDPIDENRQVVFGDTTGGDTLRGKLNSDFLFGQGGDDSLFGNRGNDYLDGGAGNDTLTGGIGSDRLEGGRGFDTYQFATADLRDGAIDSIMDIDGSGVININGNALDMTGVKALSNNTWEAGDGTRFFLISNEPTDRLRIQIPGREGTWIDVENFHNGALGITLPNYVEGEHAINTDLANAANFAVLQNAANIDLNVAGDLRAQLENGSMGPYAQTESQLTNKQIDNLLAKYDIVYQYGNDESGFSATVFKDKVTGKFVLSFRGEEFEPNRYDAFAKDGKLGALRDINREGFAFAQLSSMERLTGHLLKGETLNTVTGQWETNAALAGFSSGEIVVTGADIGGHLATAFTLMHENLVKQTYSFNGMGLGGINEAAPTASTLQTVLEKFQRMMPYRGPAASSSRCIPKPRRCNLQNPTHVDQFYAAAA